MANKGIESVFEYVRCDLGFASQVLFHDVKYLPDGSKFELSIAEQKVLKRVILKCREYFYEQMYLASLDNRLLVISDSCPDY